MRLMIYDCWIDLGGDRALPFMQDRLGQSWAGRVLGRMIAHEEARRRARQQHEEASSDDPVKAQEKRVQRKHERSALHRASLVDRDCRINQVASEVRAALLRYGPHPRRPVD